MSLRLPSQSSSDLIWLLEVNFAGREYRFSTEPVDISKDDGSVISFKGGLDDPGYSETLSRFEHSVDQQVISLDLDFEVNVADLIQKGHYLMGSEAVLSCVLSVNGDIQQTYEGRFIVLNGVVQAPQYAFPDQPEGIVSLSIEGSPSEDTGIILPPSKSIQHDVTWSLQGEDEGKSYPLIFGIAGGYDNAVGNPQIIEACPAYVLHRETDSTDANYQRASIVLIAGHHINASGVMIFNDQGQKLARTKGSVTLLESVDSLGNQVTIATLQHFDFFDTTSQEFWVGFSDQTGFAGGGIKNPYNTSEELTGAGDVIRYILSFSTLKVDHSSFAAASDFLNQFKVAGAIWDPETRPWEWVSAMAEVLPVTIRMGPKGLYPIIHDVRASASHGHEVTASPEFQQISPVQVEANISDIYNSISLAYAYNAKENDPQRYAVTNEKQSGDPSSFLTSSTTHSMTRYGQRWKRIESAYVYQRSTAQMIIKYIADTEALPARSVEYRAAPQFAFLMLGDIVSLTDSNLGFTNQACFVSAKAWDVDSWVFTLTIDRIPDRDSYTS